jgi:hypothetical protein
MAAQRFVVPFENVALTANTENTVAQVLASTNGTQRLVGYNVALNGAVDADPQTKIRIVKQTTAGTGGTAFTPNNLDTTSSVASQATALVGAFSAQPTTTTNSMLHVNGVHQKGTVNKQLVGYETIVQAPNTRLALQVNPRSSTTMTASGELIFEE